MQHNKHHDMEHDRHKHMVADFKKRFIVSSILTIPVLLLSELIQRFLRLEDILKFPGDKYVLFVLSSVIFFYGGWPFFERKSGRGASRALEELVKLMPQYAHKITSEGKTIDVPVEELKKSDRVLIKPGEKFPADGIITEGETSVNEAMLTGESRPVSKSRGMEVIGGSINSEGSETVKGKKN